MVSLWDHQKEQVSRVRDSLRRVRRSIMCAPPGGGKTRMSKHILAKKLESGQADGMSGFALFAVHRRNLVENASNSFSESPRLPHGVIMSDVKPDFKQRIQVASIDTINSWWLSDSGYSEHSYTFDLIVFDECHSHNSKLQTFLKEHDKRRAELGLNKAYVLGLSATPQAEGLADVYKEIVTGPEPSWLTENGYLKPFKYYNGTTGKLDRLVRQGQHFTTDSTIAAMEGLAGEMVRDWEGFAEGRATVGFFPSLSQAKEAMGIFRSAGIDAHYVDGKTPDEERQAIFKCLNDGSIDYICNVGVIERGTDIPRIGCIQLFVAIGSIVRYRQMIGRGSRPHPKVRDCLVLDHAENIKRHGFFDDPIEWSLSVKVTEAKDAKERPSIRCPDCGRQYRGGKCIECNYEPTAKEYKAQGLTFNGSELKEVTKTPASSKVYSDEKVLISALYSVANRGGTWKAGCAVASSKAKAMGKKWRCPKTFEIAGQSYDSIPYGDPMGNKRVTDLFPFMRRKT